MNQSPAITSTFILTTLMMIGLFFFIRASVKDRTEQNQYRVNLSEDSLLQQLRDYFAQRAYRVIEISPEDNTVTLEGNLRPSLILAIFLSFLAGLGFFCLGLVISYLAPSLGSFVYLFPLLSPLAGWFYWSKAGKVETVKFKVETVAPDNQNPYSLLTVKAHRDELIQLNETLPLEMVD